MGPSWWSRGTLTDDLEARPIFRSRRSQALDREPGGLGVLEAPITTGPQWVPGHADCLQAPPGDDRQFLKSFILNLSGEFVEYIFSMFFLSLLIMLIFSAGIIIYTGMYQSREAAFLLTTPASPDRIFAYKFF
jgi:hypothetical protein